MTPVAYRFPASVLEELRARVAATRWPDELDDGPWAHGADLATVRGLASHWTEGFSWDAVADRLEAVLPGRLVELGEHRVHVAVVPGRGPAPLPLLVLHGWPSTFAEFHRVVGPLTDPAAHGGDPADAFDLVVPSLPGHGFSSRPGHGGFGADECADVSRDLMVDALGYDRFAVHGGDRGAFVAAGLGHRHHGHVLALHLTLAFGVPGAGADRTAEEDAWLADQARFLAEEGGYSAIQGTRPQTLAYAMHDSPVGQLAWIVEKFRAWSDCDGDVLRCFTADELLTVATLYWATDTFRSAAHWYREHRLRPPVAIRPDRIDVPTAVAAFPGEVMRTPRSAVARKFDLRRFTPMPAGGHFAALEQPELLVDDLRAALRPFR